MDLYQQPVTSPVEYKKGVYTSLTGRTINVHYFGDDHLKRTQCSDPHALSLTSLLVSSFNNVNNVNNVNNEINIDMFVEVGLGLQPKHETNYLNSLIKQFQNHYGCLLKNQENREKCTSHFPNVRFHNIDFRYTLYSEYMEVISYIIKNVEGSVSNTDLMLNVIHQYALELMAGSEHEALRVPYSTSFFRDRELQRLSWIYDMVRARKNLYGFHCLTSFSETMEQFIIDLYYLIGISPVITNNNALLPSPMCNLYPPYLLKKPYYFYRLSHEYRTIPEVIKDSSVQQRFDMALKLYLKKNHLSYKRIRSLFIWATSTYPYTRKIDGHYLVDYCVMNMASFMDMYVCFRAMKPYINNVIIVCGVYHIATINQLFAELGLDSKVSASFSTIVPEYDKGVQCISVPVTSFDNPQLLFNDDLYRDMLYVNPSYHFRNVRTRYRGRKKPKQRK